MVITVRVSRTWKVHKIMDSTELWFNSSGSTRTKVHKIMGWSSNGKTCYKSVQMVITVRVSQAWKVLEESNPDVSNIGYTISCEKCTIIGEFTFIVICKNLRNHFNKIVLFCCIQIIACIHCRFTAFFQSERYFSWKRYSGLMIPSSKSTWDADCSGSETEVSRRGFFINSTSDTISDFFEIIKFDRIDPEFSVRIRPDCIIIRSIKKPTTNSDIE